MRKLKKHLDDAELMSILSKQFNYCWQDKENYAQRYGLAWHYYFGMEPRDTNQTGVEPRQVIREMVEENFQVFKTLFNDSTSSVVNVRSNNIKADVADKISQEMNVVAMNLNQISRKMEGYMKEALLTGNSHMKVYLQDQLYDERSEEFENKTQEWIDDYQKVMSSRGFNEIKFDINEKKTKTIKATKAEREEAQKFGLTPPKSYKVFSGTVKAISKAIVPSIDFIPFEQVYIHPLTQFSLDEAPYFCHSYPLSINDGLRNGWDKEIMQTGESYYETDPNFATTGLIVGQQYNPFDVDGSGITPAEGSEYFQVYEHYWRGVYRGSVPKLWRIFTTKTQLLEEPVEVDEIPFVSARVMEVPNSFYGQGIYDTAKNIQDDMTRQARMLTYTAESNAYGRLWGVRDSYDRDSVLDNRPGGIIDVESPNAIGIFPVADISQAMNLLMNDTNERYQSQLRSAGNIGDALEKFSETSGITTSLIINKSEQGIRSKASTFAETGLIPLYKKLYRLLQEIKHPVESVAPGVTMADFPKNLGMTFDVSTLTDKQQNAQNILQALQIQQQLNGGQLPNWISSENQYNALAQFVKAGTGNGDVSSYLTDPKTIKPSKAQQYMEAVQYEASITAAKAGAEAVVLENQKALSEARKNDAQAALYASEMAANKAKETRDNEMQELQMNNLILQNAKLVAEIESEKTDTALTPVRIAAELEEIDSGIIAEQANILNQNYAQGANVNVN
ncbi:TPA: hypothetical protein NQG77_000239 [Salmonella enterica subsp. enterica serovar Infantis]|nr:hypothetical protein [Salmonella enterica subsp. enterica serovar Infantis]